MRKSRFSDEQIVPVLREADHAPAGTVAKKHGASEQAIYTWRRRIASGRPRPNAPTGASQVRSYDFVFD